jgi:lysophospholipase L1-like esterase
MRDTRRSRLQLLPLFGLSAALLLPLGVTLAPPAAAARAAGPVRIMPLGDSITGSPGCRRALWWHQLESTGYTDIDFVGMLGPQGCGQLYDGDNEGHGGELVTHVADQNLLSARLAATLPDIVVMHFGTNDVWSALAADRTLAAYTRLAEQMRATNPDRRILAAQIIPMNPSSCTSSAQRVVDFNARIPEWARTTSTSRSPVSVVDQWMEFDTATDTYDGVHPRATGDEKIAARWYPALAALLDAGPGNPGDPGDPGDPGEPPDCTASFRAVSSWQGGYQGEVTVTNASASALAGWTATVVPAAGNCLTQVWNGTLAPGASASFGFIASAPATVGTPSATVTCTARAASS